MRVLVTGARGFIGRALCERWRAAGADVRGVDLEDGDIAEPGPWQAAAAGCDVLVHAAALVGMPRDASRFWAVNVRGTRLAVEAARDAGVRRFVHISSVVTFGLDFPDGVDERHPVAPTGTAYTDTKIAAEQVVLMAHAAGEIAATIVRPGDVYGPGSRPWTRLPVELMRARRFVLPAMGRGIHSPVYVDDLVEGIVRAAEADAAAGRVITLSGGDGVETRDFFGRYARMLGRGGVPCVPTRVALAAAHALDVVTGLRGAQNEVTPHAVRYLAERRGTYGIATARALLGWEPRTPLDDGMARCEAWLADEGLI